MGSGWREVPEPSSGAAGSLAWLVKHHVSLYLVTLVPLRALPLLPTSLRVTEAPAAPTEVLVNLPAARGLEIAECGALLVAGDGGRVPDAQPSPLLGQLQAQAAPQTPVSGLTRLFFLLLMSCKGVFCKSSAPVCTLSRPAEPSCGPGAGTARGQERAGHSRGAHVPDARALVAEP